MSDIGHGALRVGVKPPPGSGETTIAYNVDPAGHSLPLEEGWLPASTDGYVLTCDMSATDGSGLAWISPSAASLPSGDRNLVVATPATESGASDLRALVADDLPEITSLGTVTAGTWEGDPIVTDYIADSGVTYAKIQDVGAVSLLGNPTGSAAAPSEITLGDNLSFDGTTLVASGGGLEAIADKNLLANISGSSAAPSAHTVSDVFDSALTASDQGTILYRGASGWAALGPGTNTYVLATQGASADPHWVAPVEGGSGASVANTYIVQTTASDCSNAQVLGSLSTGLLKVTGTTGVLSTAAASDLPSTGLTITQWGGSLGSGSIVTGTATFNLNTYNRWLLTLDNTQTVTLALSGGSVGQQFSLLLSQDSTGGCEVTWFSGIKWAGGSAPTLTATASKGDLFTFLCVGTGSYWGMIAGQNF